jgi:hypothetical protein
MELSTTHVKIEWTEITLYEVMVSVIARVSNNAFSGLEFCKLLNQVNRRD